ncbi:hypothetical protein R3P38DRAFT_1605232 [Favolaschia claudopus]|uniref:Uncharacterized protein n=1 Tax=Favolaschia claudopus TaxID=2862362 RepID=A0AAW0AHD1_9AGAR
MTTKDCLVPERIVLVFSVLWKSTAFSHYVCPSTRSERGASIRKPVEHREGGVRCQSLAQSESMITAENTAASCASESSKTDFLGKLASLFFFARSGRDLGIPTESMNRKMGTIATEISYVDIHIIHSKYLAEFTVHYGFSPCHHPTTALGGRGENRYAIRGWMGVWMVGRSCGLNKEGFPRLIAENLSEFNQISARVGWQVTTRPTTLLALAC